MGQKDAIAKLTVLIAVAAGLTIGLHRMGGNDGLLINWADPVGWFDDASPEDAIGATLRTIGLAIGYWITISTALYIVVATHSRNLRPRLLMMMTLPGIRRVVDRAVATALAASIAVSPLSPALAEQPPAPPVVFDINSDGVPVPHIRTGAPTRDGAAAPGATSEEAEKEADAQLPPPVPVATFAQPTTVAAAATGYTVKSGDNLWLIAERLVQTDSDSQPSLAAITAYWRSIVDANRGTLRSGDPNLIFPGELVTIPVLEVTS